MLYQLSYAHHRMIVNSLTLRCLFAIGCNVCNRRQFSDFIRVEFWPGVSVSRNHFVTAMTNPQSNHRKGHVVLNQERHSRDAAVTPELKDDRSPGAV
jgi:hypothetical protein